jgi:trans-aconitate 2-methyltransferase
VTAKLLERLPRGRVVAMDLSQNMLQTAREHLEPKFSGQVLLIAADLQGIPLEGVLDGIFSTAAFHWVPDHGRLFRSLFRSLKPGGWLEAQCGGGQNLACVRERAAELMARPELTAFFAGWQAPWQYPDDVTTAERMRRAGFIEVKTWLEKAPATLSDASEYKEFLATVTLHRHIARISDSALREHFLDGLARQAAADNPPFTLDYWRLNLSGRRRKN